MILYYLLIVPVLSVLVFVHELGHFVMAKRAGMKVEEFGFGFPPRLWGHKPKGSETTYTINAIPFGGFVKILGEDGTSSDQRSFGAKGFWSRVSVIVAGVVMNFLFAALLLVIINAWGTRHVEIEYVVPGSPAQEAGFLADDIVTGFVSTADVQAYIQEHRGERISLSVQRGQDVIDLAVIPRVEVPPGEGAMGVSFKKMGTVWYRAVPQGFEDAGKLLWATIASFGLLLKNIFTTGKAGVELAGPLGIAVITGQAAKQGFLSLLYFTALISLNLTVINIMPFPALDGGRLLFLIIEKIKGSKLSKNVEVYANTVGFGLLLLLMLYITVKDVLKFF